MSPTSPAERVRTLLLRADNLLKRSGGARHEPARQALEEARTLAAAPGVDPRLGDLVERRLAALDAERG